jgi:copper chaperone NosL
MEFLPLNFCDSKNLWMFPSLVVTTQPLGLRSYLFFFNIVLFYKKIIVQITTIRNMVNVKMIKLFYTILIIFLLACSNHNPVDIQSGTEKCEYCKMKISNLRFNSQVRTIKGRTYHFDSIECMLGWKADVQLEKRWVKGYSSQKWIELEKAILYQSKELKSPMGAGLSAYSSAEELENIKKEYKGTEIGMEEAIQYVKTEWMKTK